MRDFVRDRAIGLGTRVHSRVLGVLVIVGVLALAGVFGACGGGLDDVAPMVGVTGVAVHDNSFDPRVIQVPAGTEVTWTWDETRNNHNVVGNGFGSDVKREGEFRHTFELAGSYDFLCTLHGGMRGRVIVAE